MLAIRLSDDIETCLYSLAKKTGRAKTFYAREAILDASGRLGRLPFVCGRRGAYSSR